jgi:hypothetical protein
MSKEEQVNLTAEIADTITVKIRTSNKWLTGSIWAATVFVSSFIWMGSQKVANAYNDIRELKESKAKVENVIAPKVEKLSTQVAVLNNVNGIPNN